MREYTDFIIGLVGGREIEFRHEVKTVHEFWLLQDPVIFDYYGFQSIKTSEIRQIRLSPLPFSIGYAVENGYFTSSDKELWKWVSTLNDQEQEELLMKYQK